ncbi:MAG: PspA/IM30 family protein [Candidatus Heimdallarchaeota archaeon]
MGIFNRLFKIGKAAANDAVDKLEDPVLMYKEAIRELEEKLNNAKQAQVKLKTVAVQLRANESKLLARVTESEEKAGKLLDKVENGNLDSEKGNKFAIDALNMAENAKNEVVLITKQKETHEKSLDKIGKQMKEFTNLIKQYKNELVNLEARDKAADASVAINKEMSNIGTSDSAKSMIDKMKAKVEAKEAEAVAYEELDDVKDVETEIDDILAGDSPSDNNDMLAKFKAARAPA